VNLVVRAGSAFDGMNPGLADMTANLLMKGTAKRNAEQLAEEVDFFGASLNTNAGWDASYISLTTPTKHLPALLEIFGDILLHPMFPEEEVKRLQALTIADLVQAKADVNYLASTRTAQVLFGRHPYGNTVTEQSINAIERRLCSDFYEAEYAPDISFVVVAGDVYIDSLAGQFEELFAGWKKHPITVRQFPEIKPVNERRVSIVAKPGAVQTSIKVGQEGVKRSDKDFLALDALNTIIGGYFNSRLNANLREKHGFTYGAHSRFDARGLGGCFVVSCDVRTEVTDKAIVEIFNELQRIVTEPVPEGELTLMKNYVSGCFPLMIETPQHTANLLQNVELYGLPEDYYATLGERVRALSSEDLLAVAKKHLHPEKMAIAMAGDAVKITDGMKQFGAVVVTDSDGNPVAKT
jgi:zinc protease